MKLARLGRNRPAHNLPRHAQASCYPPDALTLDKVSRRILPIVSTVIIPAGPLCNQRRHPPMPESVNSWTPNPSSAGQVFHAYPHATAHPAPSGEPESGPSASPSSAGGFAEELAQIRARV